MSTYGYFINNTLEAEYASIKVLKNEDTSKIEVFKHKNSDNKLVRILSKNRNDHIYRELRGKKHENLAPVLEVCSCEEHLLVIEGYIPGEALSAIVEKQSLSAKTVISYIFDVCKALQFLHEKSIIHRDIKPGNIIITPQNKAVLIDFSAARLMNGSGNRDTANLGTVGYAAPEQYGVSQSSPPTDIYALGVMFNEMLTKQHPSVTIPSGKIGRIIKKCTDTQISKRYQTIEALVKDLKKYQRFHK